MHVAYHAAAGLWRREILKFVRDRSRLFGALAQPIGFWLLLGLGFQRSFVLPGTAGAGYLEYLFPGIVALIVLFTAIFSTISVVEERQSGFLQAALVAPVSRLALVAGNALGGTTLAVLETALFLLLLPATALRPGVSGVAVVLGLSALLGIGFTALGFTIAWRMASTRGFHAVMNLFLMPLWLLSGAPFPVEGASPVLRWVMWLNPVTYAVSGLRQGLYGAADAPGAVAPLWVSGLVTAAFAGVMLLVAARTSRRSLYG